MAEFKRGSFHSMLVIWLLLWVGLVAAAVYGLRAFFTSRTPPEQRADRPPMKLPAVALKPDADVVPKENGAKEVDLVTGGLGFLGKHVVEQLLARKAEVRVLDVVQGTDPRVTSIKASILDEDALVQAFRGCDTVFHLASLVEFVDYARMYNINVVGTACVINACVRAGVKRLIYTSTIGVVIDGKPHLCVVLFSHYLRQCSCAHILLTLSKTKAKAEQLVLQANGRAGLLTCALRPPALWGVGDRRVLDAAVFEGHPLMGSENVQDWLYVENCAHAHLCAADHLTSDSPVPGSAYFITNHEPMCYLDFMRRSKALSGRPLHKLPYAAWYAITICVQFIFWLGNGYFRGEVMQLCTGVLVHACITQYHCPDKATKELGYKPLYTMAESWQRALEIYRKQGKLP